MMRGGWAGGVAVVVLVGIAYAAGAAGWRPESPVLAGRSTLAPALDTCRPAWWPVEGLSSADTPDAKRDKLQLALGESAAADAIGMLNAGRARVPNEGGKLLITGVCTAEQLVEPCAGWCREGKKP